MTVRQVIDVMRGLTGALGVRCTYCHVGQEGQPLTSYDFPSDSLRTKRTARLMFQMVRDINERTLSQIPERPVPNVQVTCATCHRGVSRPVPLGDLIVAALRAGGPDSAAATYRRLRERYYGSASYDFGEASLGITALELRATGRLDEALALLQINDAQFRSSIVAYNIGEVQLARRDTAAAIEAYRTALQRDSTNQGARMRLRALGQP